MLWEVFGRSLGELLALFAAIFVGAMLIVWIRSRYRDREDPAADDHQMLAQVGELHREGDLSEEEYRSIKHRLVERIDRFTRE